MAENNKLPEARGNAFLGILVDLKQSGGAALLERVVENSGPVAKQVLSEPIDGSSWYSYEAFADLLRSADQHAGQGDGRYCRRVGELAAKRDMPTILEIYKQFGLPSLLIRACEKIWMGYYRNAGRMEAISSDPTMTILRIFDFPAMDPHHCRLMEGWMSHAMELMGVNVVEMVETACASQGGAYHEFRCRWGDQLF